MPSVDVVAAKNGLNAGVRGGIALILRLALTWVIATDFVGMDEEYSRGSAFQIGVHSRCSLDTGRGNEGLVATGAE